MAYFEPDIIKKYPKLNQITKTHPHYPGTEKGHIIAHNVLSHLLTFYEMTYSCPEYFQQYEEGLVAGLCHPNNFERVSSFFNKSIYKKGENGIVSYLRSGELPKHRQQNLENVVEVVDNILRHGGIASLADGVLPSHVINMLDGTLRGIRELAEADIEGNDEDDDDESSGSYSYSSSESVASSGSSQDDNGCDCRGKCMRGCPCEPWCANSRCDCDPRKCNNRRGKK